MPHMSAGMRLANFPAKRLYPLLCPKICTEMLMPLSGGPSTYHKKMSPAGVLASFISMVAVLLPYVCCIVRCFESKADTGGLADGKACFLPKLCLDFRRKL